MTHGQPGETIDPRKAKALAMFWWLLHDRGGDAFELLAQIVKQCGPSLTDVGLVTALAGTQPRTIDSGQAAPTNADGDDGRH